MKRSSMRILSFVLFLFVISLPWANAEVPAQLFDKEFCSAFMLSGEDAVIYDTVYTGGRLYAVMGAEKYGYSGSGEIYYYDVEANEYGFLTKVKPRAYGSEKNWKDQTNEEKLTQDNRVFQLIGAIDTGMLYGFNPASGHIGAIDQDGIHWSETKLDTALLIEFADTLPQNLSMPFIDGNALYGYASPNMFSAEDANCSPEGLLLSFDLTTGVCRSVYLPDTYAFCPYTPGKALLLRRMSSGRLFLSTFDLNTLTIEHDTFAKLPVSSSGTSWFDVCLDTADIGGLSYCAETDTIFALGKAGLWQSIAGAAFEMKDTDWPDHFFGGTMLDWLTIKQSWAMPDGSLVRGSELIR